METAIHRFITLANSLVRELEHAIAQDDPAYYGNAEVALSNVRSWRDLAVSGNLPGAFRPDFGISRAGLMFGPAEPTMYKLERLYIREILPSASAL